MEPINRIWGWDWPDRKQVPNGYDMESVPECTDDNFLVLVERFNELVESHNALLEKIQSNDKPHRR